jgi:50S ribosomal subunit-associated GTPase HflX
MSSRDVESVAELRRTILDAVRVHHRERTVFVPYDRADVLGKIYATCRVLETTATPNGTQIVIEGEAHVVDAIARATRRRRT